MFMGVVYGGEKWFGGFLIESCLSFVIELQDWRFLDVSVIDPKESTSRKENVNFLLDYYMNK